ncbi:recombinase family protein [Candidatus Nomurabacteria bacterium]|nr:recombinase family protein [Candidatus Nomurabacteria bacterium]
MLSIAFGQSKYYVDSLAENTKRGLRQKVRRGEYPALAPIGYINDVRTKTVVQDKRKAPIICEAFELYAKNESRLADIADFLATHSITTKHGNRLHRDRISFILSNPFYVGLFRYGGELYEGKHEPVIAKPLFDRVQEILKDRGKPKRKPKNEPKAFCGLLTCGSCSMGITAEVQKGHTYYRCTKKRGNCHEPYVREESLDEQLSVLLSDMALPAVWAKRLNQMLAEDKKNISQTAKVGVDAAQKELEVVNEKLSRLLDGYLEQDIERETYLEKKAMLLSEKQSLQTKISNYSSAHLNWLEPFEKWINEAQNLAQIATADNLFEKKVVAKEIFGSNLHLRACAVVAPALECGSAEPLSAWAALRAAHASVGSKTERLIMVPSPGIEPRFSP